MNWITQIAKEHKEWVRITKMFGGNLFAEDIVQEVYIRLMKYSSENLCIIDGKINKPYIYFVLRNTFLLMQKGNRPEFIDLTNLHNIREHESNLDNYIELENAIEKEVSNWHWYDQKLWSIYRDEQMSIRKISEKTKISSKSIFTSLKSCKTRIKKATLNEWNNYKNNE